HNPDNTYEKAETWDEYASYRDKNIKRSPGRGLPDEKIRANVTNKYNLRKIFYVNPGTNEFDDFMDYQTATHAVGFLEEPHQKPFFLAVGFIRPHIEFTTPESYYDKFSDPIESPAVKDDDLNDVPPVGKSMVRKVAADIEKLDSWEELRRGYLACIAFTDYNVGRVLEALENSPYADNTVVILWSDHGFHLGEKQSYTKFSLWEESTRVPFIIYDPRGRDGNGKATDEPVGLINVYRTVCELVGLEPPEYVDGFSLVPWLDDPALPVDRPAMTTWGRGNYTLRSKDWRYTRYYDGTEELYDHRNDPNEWNNLADDRAYADVKREMEVWLPKEEAPQVASGRKLYNVSDADKPLN
ncbi:MAG: sulfatase-like hydrolase/transferase, partial [Verrucomicrobiota bacterium]